MCNTCLISGGGGLLGRGMGTSFVYALGSKLGLNKGYIGVTMVSLSGGKTHVEVLGKEDLMNNGN